MRTLAALVLLIPALVRAQASPYVPVDDIAYRYVDALIARGYLRSLSALERPYTVGRVRAALDSSGLDSTSGVVASYAKTLSTSLRRYELTRARDTLFAGVVTPENGGQYNRIISRRGPTIITQDCYVDHCSKADTTTSALPFRANASFDVYGTAQSSDRRELMLADAHDDVKPGMAGYFVFAGGHLAGSVRALLDNRLNVDPEFAGRKDRKIAGRTEDAYVSGQWKYAEATFGRVARNWGPPALQGLLLGDAPYTYDHLYARIGTEQFHVATVIARLENFVLSPGVESSRYFSLHRLAYRRGAFEGGLSEAYLYSGVARGLEFSLINPFNVFALSWRNERTDGNMSFGFDLSWRSRVAGTWSAQLLLDDVQIDKCDTICNEPSSYGFSLTADGLPGWRGQRPFASYTRVSNLAYRTPNIAERYAVYGVGLARGYSDYDEMRLGIDLAVVPRTPLKLYVAHRRQGEGDYRKAYPAPSQYAATPVFLSGVVWTANRIGLSGATIPFRDFQLAGDAGFNQVKNRRNIVGNDITVFEGRAKVIWVPRWLIRFQ